MLRIPTMTTMTTATLTWSSCWVSAGPRPWSWREWWWFPSGPRRSSWTTPPPSPRLSSGTAAPHCHHDNQSESHRQKIHPYFVGTSIVLLTYCIMNFINNWDSLLWAWIFTPFWVSFHFTKMFITQLNVSVVLWQDVSFLVNISLPGSKPGLSGSTPPLPGSALPLHLIKHLHSTCLNTCTLPVSTPALYLSDFSLFFTV